MKIDVNVKLYYDEETGKTFTEEEIQAQIKEDVEDEIAAFKSGDFHDYNGYFEDFLREQSLSLLNLVDCIFNKDEAESLVDRYANHLTKGFTEFKLDELCVIEKTIQVEI